jgi:hypothetical protein
MDIERQLLLTQRRGQMTRASAKKSDTVSDSKIPSICNEANTENDAEEAGTAVLPPAL